MVPIEYTAMNGKQISQPTDDKSAKEAHDYLLAFSELTVRFARVKRRVRYPDGAKESDVEHSYHLALSAAELAGTYFPELDTGLVTQFALVHDLPELHAGDVPSFNISNEDRAKKEQAEKEALSRLLRELPPYTAQLLERYERQEEPEARFVRFVDKVLPVAMIVVAGSANTFKEDYDLASLPSLREIREREAARLQALFPEFPFIQIVRDLIVETSSAQLFPEEA